MDQNNGGDLKDRKWLKDIEAVFPKEKEVINWKDTEGHDRFDDVFEIYSPDNIVSFKQESNHFVFESANGFALSVAFQNDHIIRFRYAREGEFERDHSYAIDPAFQQEEVYTLLEESGDYYKIIGHEHHVHVSKSDAAISIFDVKGNVLCSNQKHEIRHTILEGITHVKLSQNCHPKENFFGLGDKSCSLDLHGKQLENWNTDAFGYGTNSDPLYRAIPFYYGLHEWRGYGIFFDNSYRSHFDFNSSKDNCTSMWAAGGEMNYYFIGGPELMDVAQRYTTLTGKADLPPMWGLGFHQCRWSYYPESRVRSLADEFRKRAIPCDAIYLDIDYMDGYRCFTVNEKHFPDLGKMISDLKEDGFHTIVMIDPGIRVDSDYHVYADGKAKDMFCRRKDGKLMRGPVWPQDCVFPDYTDPKVRKWWGDLYEKLYKEQGVSGFWNDMNEPAVFKVNSKTFPEDVRHDYEGHGAEHARIHNIYGQQMVRATQGGLLRLQPNKRPLVITRATFAGGQRYSSSWTGDNVASWEHLAIANRQCQRMSISGFSYIGTDIGGFIDQPTGELMVRWLQLAVFHPLFRIHSMGNNEDGAAEADADKIAEAERVNRMDQEPWVFGEKYERLAKRAIELRYELLPYLYSSFWQHSTSGVPVIRQFAFVDQQDPIAVSREDEFMYGDHLLVVNICEPGKAEKEVYLPKGSWINYWTKKEAKADAGKGEFLVVENTLEHIPIFVKGGAIIPEHKVRQSTSEKVEELQLHVYCTEGTFSQEIYEDKGEGFEHRSQEFLLRKVDVSVQQDAIEMKARNVGDFMPQYERLVLHFHNVGFSAQTAIVNEENVDFEQEGSSIVLKINKPFFESISINK